MYHQVANFKQISLAKVANVLCRLTTQELEALEELLDEDTMREILDRANDPRVAYLTHDELVKKLA